MSATARRTGPVRTGAPHIGAPRAGAPRTGAPHAGTPHAGVEHSGVHHTGSLRTGVHRTGSLRTGPRSVPVRPELQLVPPAPARPRPARPRAASPASRRAPFVLLVVALLAGTTLALLVLNTAIAVDSLRATSLRQGNVQREQEVQRLQQQVIDGSTPQRLAADAGRAGMVPAGTPGYLVVEPDGSSTLRGTPAPAPAATLPPVPGTTPAPSSPGAGTAPATSPAPAPPTTPPSPAAPTTPGASPAPSSDQAAGD